VVAPLVLTRERPRHQATTPALALPHAPPQSRAPPVGLPSDLF